MNNNELLVYTLLLVITLLIIGMPKDKLVLTQNTGNLVLGFVCVTLFMLLDKRIAIIFLILLVVTYYENMKTELDNKVADIQLENIKEKFYNTDAADAAATKAKADAAAANAKAYAATANAKAYAAVAKAKADADAAKAKADADAAAVKAKADAAKDTPVITISPYQTLARTEQVRLNNIGDIEKNISNFITGINSLKAEYLTFDTNLEGSNLCDNIKKYNKKIGEYEKIKDTFANITTEGFLKDYIPQPIPRAKNFKNSNLVKNISNLESQNVEGQFDIQGCRMLEAKSSAIDYNTNFGPPLAKNETYQTNETIRTPFYPLSA